MNDIKNIETSHTTETGLDYTPCYQQPIIDTKFSKNHIPWNKGKKGSQVAWNKGIKMKPETYEKVKSTMFKKGGLPPTTKHFGKPYLHTRIRNDGTKEQTWFIHVNQKRLRYLKYLCDINGIDLTGKKPRLKPDFDINQEPTINDIIIVTNREHMQLNSMQRFPEEVRKLIQIKGALNRQINKRL